MHRAYSDILRRIEQDPLWWDENAVPRFDPFKPDQLAKIYAREAVLLRIACQGCGALFDVAMSSINDVSHGRLYCEHSVGPLPMLRHFIWGERLHYGDPPNTGCCNAGATMGAISQEVLQYWVKPYALGEGCVVEERNGRVSSRMTDVKSFHWRRDPTLETTFSRAG